ncbi:hypothetical protein DFH27DRAFT_638558 [Peziza echinospora]|nr:hypothetical protein DFH27DRAFT_638558 [Peziza echinospora]
MCRKCGTNAHLVQCCTIPGLVPGPSVSCLSILRDVCAIGRRRGRVDQERRRNPFTVRSVQEGVRLSLGGLSLWLEARKEMIRPGFGGIEMTRTNKRATGDILVTILRQVDEEAELKHGWPMFWWPRALWRLRVLCSQSTGHSTYRPSTTTAAATNHITSCALTPASTTTSAPLLGTPRILSPPAASALPPDASSHTRVPSPSLTAKPLQATSHAPSLLPITTTITTAVAAVVRPSTGLLADPAASSSSPLRRPLENRPHRPWKAATSTSRPV